MPQFKRLVRFVPKSDPSKILIGQPTSDDLDVGAALYNGEDVAASVFSGHSVLSPGQDTSKTETIAKVLSPLARGEVGTIRCIGLNYKRHAEEVGKVVEDVPTLFMKPETSLADPWPAKIPLPPITKADDTGDYEAELVVVIGKTAKNVSEAHAMDYILGYTAANDVSSRASQGAQSQWCFSKGFDGACPIGPVLVSPSLIPDPSKLHMRGLKNGKVMQDSGIDDLIFSVPKLISFLSQGTTLLPGTIILTGTPSGVGFTLSPPVRLREGDEFRVEITPYVGTLINEFVWE